MTRALGKRVSAARAEVARAYDPLLDLRSCDLGAVRALALRGAERLGAQVTAKMDAGAALQAVASLLEARLEAVTVEAARRVGLESDSEVDVLPGEVSFKVGPELKVDALAGFDLEKDRVVLGSFKREVAVKREENDSFATGHPLVEALFGWLRDGELGRATVARGKVRGVQGAALDARFVVALPEPADLAQGARVPSRRAARHLDELLIRIVVRLDSRGGARVEEALGSQIDSALLEAVPAPDGGPPAAFVQAVELGLRVAQEEARGVLLRLVTTAQQKLASERDVALARLGRWLGQSRVKPAEAEKARAAEAKLYGEVAEALLGARLELDQV